MKARFPQLRRRALAALTAALFVTVMVRPLAAHPSIVMNCRVLFEFKDGKVDHVGEAWTFDRAFSQELMSDFDSDKDGKLSDTESIALSRDVLGNIAKQDYLTLMTVDGHSIDTIKPSGARALADGGVVTFAFAWPLQPPLDPRQYRISVEIRDTEFVVYARMAASEPVIMRGNPPPTCRTKIIDDKPNAYFGGAVIPQAVVLQC